MLFSEGFIIPNGGSPEHRNVSLVVLLVSFCVVRSLALDVCGIRA